MKHILTDSLSDSIVSATASVIGTQAKAASKVNHDIAEGTAEYLASMKKVPSSKLAGEGATLAEMRAALTESFSTHAIRNMDDNRVRIAYNAQIAKYNNTNLAEDTIMSDDTLLDEGQGSFNRNSGMKNQRSRDNWKSGNAKKPFRNFDRDKRSMKDFGRPDKEVDESALENGKGVQGLQIDETSQGFRNRYTQVANKLLAKDKYNSSKKAAERIRKRTAGIKSANAVTNRASDRKWQLEQAKDQEVHDHITKKMPSILKAHGYQEVGKAGKWNPHTLYVKNHPEHGVSTHVKLYHERPDGKLQGRTLAKFGSSTGWQSSDDNHDAEARNWDRFKRDIPVSERKKDAEDHFIKKIKEHETYHQAKALEESAAFEGEVLSEALTGKLARSAVQAGLTYAKHHEEINGLLKGIATHLKAHAKEAEANPWGDGRDHSGPNWGHVGSMEHYRSQLQSIHDSLAGKGHFAESFENDEEMLDEEEMKRKRGRPRKNPLPDTKAKPASLRSFDDEDDEEPDTGPEANMHIMNQVRKAADSGLKPHYITFLNGEKKPVVRSQARALMNKYNKLKPSEKETMQNHMAQSHANLLSHL